MATQITSTSSEVAKPEVFPIKVSNLTFGYPGRKTVLHNVNMELTRGSRCLLIGANGAGKSTLLRILSGRHKTNPDDSVTILGRSAFFDTRLNFERAYLDTDWGMRTVAFAGYGCPLQADIPVHGMMAKLQSDYPERRDELIELLGVDLNWRMHEVSDGQRRRVQIFIGLIRPFQILLLDEVTISLDVVVRQDLLRWLKREAETRGATILYATHIFDGLDSWPTHLHYLSNKGTTGWSGPIGELDLLSDLRARGEPSPLLRVAEDWLRTELEEKKRECAALRLAAAAEAAEAAVSGDCVVVAKDAVGSSLSRVSVEPACGPAAQAAMDPSQSPFLSGGGFSSGRMAAYNVIR